MANGDSSKSPTWQWFLGIAVSIILIIAGVSLTETRSDIRDGKKATSDLCDRVTVIETANRIQFEEIKAWRKDVKDGMKEIADKIDTHTTATAQMKRWQDIPASRGNN